MLNKIHEILRDPQCSGNIKCVVWGSVCVSMYFGMMCFLFFLFGDTIGDYKLSTRNQWMRQVEVELYRIEEMRVDYIEYFAMQVSKIAHNLNTHERKMHYGQPLLKKN